MSEQRSSNLISAFIRSLLLFVLGRDATAALIRFIIVAGFLAVQWVITIVGLRFPGEIPLFWLRNLPQFTYPLINIASTFLNPEVLLHFLPVVAGIILSLVIAARYLSDLFELDRFETAWRYLGGAVYGLSTPKLRIDRGDKNSLDPHNPIRRIGGPGVIQTHLGYAAVFESIDGIPRIYAATQPSSASPHTETSTNTTLPRASHTLRGFERLRDVVDLRDRIAKVDLILAETHDGVEILAEDAQMVFRVFGGDQQRSLNHPYPYAEEAIRRIVYAQPIFTGRRRSPTEALKEIVRNEIRAFVGRYTLEQFLALQPYRQLIQASEQSGSQETSADGSRSIQIPRRELTDRFHTDELRQRLKEQGLALDWVGVGTWNIHEFGDGQDAAQTLIQTWRDSQRLMLYRSPDYIDRQGQLSFQQRPNIMIREWVDAWRSGDLPHQYRCYEVLTTLARQIDILEKELEGQTEILENLRRLRDHINSLIDPAVLGSDS
jgi:hypothetical protein